MPTTRKFPLRLYICPALVGVALSLHVAPAQAQGYRQFSTFRKNFTITFPGPNPQVTGVAWGGVAHSWAGAPPSRVWNTVQRADPVRCPGGQAPGFFPFGIDTLVGTTPMNGAGAAGPFPIPMRTCSISGQPLLGAPSRGLFNDIEASGGGALGRSGAGYDILTWSPGGPIAGFLEGLARREGVDPTVPAYAFASSHLSFTGQGLAAAGVSVFPPDLRLNNDSRTLVAGSTTVDPVILEISDPETGEIIESTELFSATGRLNDDEGSVELVEDPMDSSMQLLTVYGDNFNVEIEFLSPYLTSSPGYYRLGSSNGVITTSEAGGVLVDVPRLPVGSPAPDVDDPHIAKMPPVQLEYDASAHGPEVEYTLNFLGAVNPAPVPPDQLHIIGPVPNIISSGDSFTIEASVQSNLIGLGGRQLVFSKVEGDLLLGDFSLVSGTVSEGGDETVVFTGPDGEATVIIVADGSGPALLRASVPGTPLQAFFFFSIADGLQGVSVKQLPLEQLEEIAGIAPSTLGIELWADGFQIIDLDMDENDRVSITWTSEPGKTFSVQSSEDIDNWKQIAEDLPSSGATTSFRDELPLDGARFRYYRVVETGE